MAQKVVFVFIDGTLSDEILTYTPDTDDLLTILDNMGYEASDGEIEAGYEWYDIGSGESDTDEFFTEKELYDMRLKGSRIFENEITKAGYDCALVTEDSTIIEIEEDE